MNNLAIYDTIKRKTRVRIGIMKKNAIISLAMLYALWQTKRSDLLDLIRPFVLYAVGVTTKVGDIIDVEGICRYMESEFGYQSLNYLIVTTH